MPAKTPAETDDLFGACANAADLEGLVALYEPDATLVAGDAGVLVGHDSIRAYLAGLVALKPTIDMGDVTVVPMDENLALLHHDWRATFTGPDGKPAEMSGKATEVVRRQGDGTWLFLLDDPDMRS